MKTRLWSGSSLATFGLLFALASIGGSLDGREARRTVIRGRIVSVATEAPVAGATVAIKGVGEATTNASGRYKIRVAGDIKGLRKVVVNASGHLRRKTWLDVSGTARRIRADWNLMPSSSPEFDSIFFDELLRPTAAGTSRWERVPVVRILTRKLDCIRLHNFETCPEWIVSSLPMSTTMMQWVQVVIEDLPPLIGGVVPSVEIVDLPAGASVQTDRILVPGALTLGERTLGADRDVFPAVGPGEAIDGVVSLLNFNDGRVPSDFLRQVARGLGYHDAFRGTRAQQCLDLSNRGFRSIHCEAHGLEHPNALDAALGRALYTRSVGNRSPDTDPKPELGTRQ